MKVTLVTRRNWCEAGTVVDLIELLGPKDWRLGGRGAPTVTPSFPPLLSHVPLAELEEM